MCVDSSMFYFLDSSIRRPHDNGDYKMSALSILKIVTVNIRIKELFNTS